LQRRYRAGAALILDALGLGEQLGLDAGSPEHSANPAHGLAHGVEESSAGVLHEVPSDPPLG